MSLRQLACPQETDFYRTLRRPGRFSDEQRSTPQNPFKCHVDCIKPKYDKRGLTTAQRDRKNGVIVGGTGSCLLSTFQQQLPTILRSLPALQEVKGPDASGDVASKTFAGQTKLFDAS